MLRFYPTCVVALLLFCLLFTLIQADEQSDLIAVRKVAEVNNHFGMNMYKRLLNTTTTGRSNLAFCPISLTLLLSMIYLGAEGNTASELNATLGYFETQLNEEDLWVAFKKATRVLQSRANENNQQTTLRLANAIWTKKASQAGSAIDKTFSASLERFFDASVREVENFNSAEFLTSVNQWASSATDGLVPNLLESPPSAATRIMLLSAIYFSGNWETQFDPRITFPGDFRMDAPKNRRFRPYRRRSNNNRTNSLNPRNGTDNSPLPDSPSTTKTVSMMRLETNLRYARSDVWGANLVEMPYEGRESVMIVIVPDENVSLSDMEQKFDADTLMQAIGDMESGNVQLTMPRFQISATLPLKQPLQRAGLTSLFDPSTAQLPGFAALPETGGSSRNNGRNVITDVLQKVVVKVDETGSRAAAVSVSIFSKKRQPSTRIVHANRPFMFLIGHMKTGAILFMGRVTDPTS